MNVFESIKGKFHNVQQDLYDGIKALTSLEKQPSHGMLHQLHRDGINLDAGADLLNKYQKTWKELQDVTVENAQRAENVDCQIGLLYVRWDRQMEMMVRLETEVKELPSMVRKLSEITDMLGSVELSCKQLEKDLEVFEDICDQEIFQREQKSHILQLNNYKKIRNEELEKIKAQMAKHHEKTMKAYEKQKLSKLKEREAVFSEAFSEDVNYYQTHGHIEKIAIPKVSSLSEITLEEDRQVLDEFLESTEGDNSKDIPGKLELSTIPIPKVTCLNEVCADQDKEKANISEISELRKHSTSISEGTFFEDDYTADYSADFSISACVDETEENSSSEETQTVNSDIKIAENSLDKGQSNNKESRNVESNNVENTKADVIGAESSNVENSKAESSIVENRTVKSSKDVSNNLENMTEAS